MASVTTFKETYRGIKESECLISELGLTAEAIEDMLQQPEYQLMESVVIKGKKNLTIVEQVEKVTGYGEEMTNAFETLMRQYGRIPTQKEFHVHCQKIAEDFWIENQPNGIAFSDVVSSTITNRNLRTYLSQVNEIHCLLLLKELFPQWGVYSSDDLDLLMGVDILVETEYKRLYLHLFKNSQYSFRAFRRKQYRGGMKNAEGKFIRYTRSFDGDKVLMYEGSAKSSSATTKFINGVPLFRKEWLKSQLQLFNDFPQFGEPLADTDKLDYFEQYLNTVKGVVVI